MRKRIISKLDIKDHNLVKGIQLEGLRVLGNPNDFAKEYYNSGVDEIIVQDVIASLYGKKSITSFLKNFSKDVFIPICVGGGIKEINDVLTLMNEGADKVSLNTHALLNPNFINELVKNFGSSTICINIEVKNIDNEFKLIINNGRDLIKKKFEDWVMEIQDRGVGEIHINSIDNDGMENGVNYKLLDVIKNMNIKVPVIYSGGFNIDLDEENLMSLSKFIDGLAIGYNLHKNNKFLKKDDLWFRDSNFKTKIIKIENIISSIRKKFK